ncbi:MAG: penicillin-binding protein 1C [Candidatus Latescibacterota bacterium]|nr:MAG: penicillin-binding protein 1C [Candidatus Latescibacterota bacterium]
MSLKRKYAFTLLVLIAGVAIWLMWPVGPLFPNDYSTLVFDANGEPLRVTLAGDEQYRFSPEATPLPEKYVTALLTSEDRRFYSHPGVDPLALAKAAITNIRTGKRLRGGSTITMQLARLANPKPRTYLNKLRECLEAVKLSLHFSKEDVLRLYAAHAPMGGNVIGLQAASYLYYGKPATELTWAESALFATLPNSPSMINLERERPLLVRKRNALLKRIHDRGIIDRLTFEAACEEALPEENPRYPFVAPHFTQAVLKKPGLETSDHRGSGEILTTLDRNIQRQVADAARRHHSLLAKQGVHNLAVLVAETKTGEIRAYVGSQDFRDPLYGGQVDGVRASRSTGSLLKPVLVARALDRGPFTMLSKIQDIPTFYGTFAPQNASKKFIGLVGLDEVLIQSLNVPSVRLLNAYGVADFYDFLVGAGLDGLFRGADGYGLALVLGGAEASLYELVELYVALGNLGRARPLRSTTDGSESARPTKSGDELFSHGAAWLVLNTLTRLSRPGSEYYWDRFNDQIPVAWKTGTSYGQKDAWAVGVNAQWTIGVWVGNFTGEGNAELSGARSAAPLLFTLFNTLTRHDQPIWFDEPFFDLEEIACCTASGYPVGPYCDETVKTKRPRRSHALGRCPFHQKYLVDKATGKSVCSLCWEGVETEWVYRFILPPDVKEVLTRSGCHVDTVPEHSAECPDFRDGNRIELVYPVDGVKIFVPRDFDGEHEKIVLSAKHREPSTHLFWFLNGSFVGETVGHHECPIDLDPGSYKLTIEDEDGFSRSVTFTAYKKDA